MNRLLSPTAAHVSWALALLALSGCSTLSSLGITFGNNATPSAPGNTPLLPALAAIFKPVAEADLLAPRGDLSAPSPVPLPLTPASAGPDALAVLLPPAARGERRFSISLSNASPDVVFMALLNETPLSVAVDPAVKGPISIALRNVTLREALDLMRELHSLEYRVVGRHILVGPAQLQTRIFTVDYPQFNRTGRSELRVVSGSITGSGGGSSSGGGNSSGGTGGGNSSSGGSSSSGGGGGGAESSHVSTSQRNDLWADIEATIKLLIGEKEGRNVVVSPQTGSIVVRALPKEMRAIADYLDGARLSVQRQVMLEAKIVEVQLSNSERSGINWGAFKTGTTAASGGVINSGASLATTGALSGLANYLPGSALSAPVLAGATGSVLGLAFQTRNFAAVLEFLETQGSTQVLSSPRIATLNNQKAVLKVGTDDFFVTNVSTTSTPVGNTTSTTPSITVQPFFSGISLDVTPNIDAQGYITLHIHPAVSTVSERTKVLNLGSQGSFSLPLASSEINESDAIVRARDGNIIAIGGLMRQSSVNTDSGIPGLEGSWLHKALGGQAARMSEKRELVILLKPTVIDATREDTEANRDTLQRLLDWTEGERGR